jgi:hypothetical protein
MTCGKRPSRAARWFSLFTVLFSACSSNGSNETTTAVDDAGTDSGADAGPAMNLPWDWTGIIGTGQSLSVGGGNAGQPARYGSQMYNNLKLALNGAVVPPFDPTLDSLSMVPLTEPIRPTDPGYPSPYPVNLDGESPHTVMSEQITKMVMDAAAAPDYVTVHTVVGESGQPMSVIKKDGFSSAAFGRAYAATLFEVAAIARLAAAAGKTYGLGAITLIHGEADAANGNYANDIFQLYSDYNADLPPLTGQTTSIPMLVSQQNSSPTGAGTASISAAQQWKVSVDHPGDIICVGPKYQYDYSGDSSRLHISALEYDKLGEKIGQVYFERVVRGHDWQPLQPLGGAVSGNTITIQFHVPVPPLVWDDTLPPPHAAGTPWANGRGFEVSAAGMAQTIDAVDIIAADAVSITCHNDLSGLAVTVGYAMTTDGKTVGTTTFRWGHLKDSDPFVGSVTNTPQPNWAVAFSKGFP